MRPIPAPRLGDTHGLLRAINERERLRLDEFITEFSIEELFPPGLENALGRTRQFVSFARSAGLLNEDRGSVELTEIGKRYVRASDADAVFDVSADQAEWLRRQLRERHMTDSIYHGAAIGLSLFASNPPDFQVSLLDFGRALAYLGRAGWDNENTLESQGERYTTFLRDLELIDDESRLTETGTQAKAELTLPIHMSLRDLAGQLNPGGAEAAAAEGEAEWATRAAAAEPEPEPEPEPVVEEPTPEPEEDEDDGPGATGEYEEVRSGVTAPVDPEPPIAPVEPEPPAAPAEPAAAGRPVPPSDIWETAAPDETTRAYSAISPEQAAAAAASADDAPMTSGDPLAGSEPEAEPVTGPPAAVDAGEPLGAGGAASEAGDQVAEADEEPALPLEAGDPLAPAPAGEAEAPTSGPPAAVDAGDPLAAGAAAPEAGADRAGDPLAGADVPSGGDPLSAGAPAPGPAADVPVSGDPLAAGAGALASGDPLAGGVETPEPSATAPEAEADVPVSGDPLAAGAVTPEPAPTTPEPAATTPEPAATTPEPTPVAPAEEDLLASGSVAPAGDDPLAAADDGDPLVDAGVAAAQAADPLPEAVPPAPAAEPAPPAEVADAVPVAVTSTREPSGFLDLASLRAAAEESGLKLPDSVYAGIVAALTTGKHLVLSGPAGSGKSSLALAIVKAAVQAGRSEGAALATASPTWTAENTVGRVGPDGFSQGHVLSAAGKKKWLLIDEIDRAELDQAFGDLSSFLGGLPLSLPDGSREVAAPADWRIVATRDSGAGPFDGSSALLRRFAQVHLPRPATATLEEAIDKATEGDPTAAAAVKRLLAADLPELGAGTFLDAAKHAAERNALSPATEDQLAHEAFAAYVAPQLHAEPARVKELEDTI